MKNPKEIVSIRREVLNTILDLLLDYVYEDMARKAKEKLHGQPR
jgi:hypothetical protein